MPLSHFLLMSLLIYGHSSKEGKKKLGSIFYILNCLIWIDADYLDSYRIVHFAVIHRFFFNLFHFFIRHIEMSIQWWNQSIFSLILYHWLYSGCLLACLLIRSFTGRISIKTYFQLFQHDIEYVWKQLQIKKTRCLHFHLFRYWIECIDTYFDNIANYLKMWYWTDFFFWTLYVHKKMVFILFLSQLRRIHKSIDMFYSMNIECNINLFCFLFI